MLNREMIKGKGYIQITENLTIKIKWWRKESIKWMRYSREFETRKLSKKHIHILDLILQFKELFKV